MSQTTFSIDQIRECVGGTLAGPGDLAITGIEEIGRAAAGDLTFIGAARYADKWPASDAKAALVSQDLDIEPGPGRALVRVPDADLALAAVLEMFAPPAVGPERGVHARAFVDPQASLGRDVAVGAMSFIGPRVTVGDGTVIHPNVTLLEDVTIGAGCVLWPGVVVRERCVVGDGCTLHNNVSIGADGFGYRPSADGRSLVKIPHIGGVRLGNGVEIGAGSTVDRGKFSDTEIGDGSKIDNLVQIGHNCRIGRSTIMVSMTGMGGSATIGDGVIVAGGCSISDHVTIGDGARLGGASAVIHDIPPGATWQGAPAKDVRVRFREIAAVTKLPEMLKTLKRERRAGAVGD